MQKSLKKIISLFLACIMVLLCVGCSKQGSTETPDNNSKMNPPISGESKVLIAYFSWSGNTNQLAEMISTESGGELFRIVPETPPKANLRQTAHQVQARTMHQNCCCRRS